MKKIIIANSNPIYEKLEASLINRFDVKIINDKSELTYVNLQRINPEYIFFPHWSFMIPPEIYQNFNCVVFHMTDLPFGRGGSPLQNLIVRGHKKTKLSALKVDKGIDTGEIYLKEDLDLYGTAEEIFLRVRDLIENMIEKIVNKQLQPYPQLGDPEVFKRRKPDDGNIDKLEELIDVYDYIRMLDAEGYPKAFIETEHLKFEFSRATFKKDGIIADVRIFKK